MTTILRLDSSVRHNDSSQKSHRSISKQLGDVFIQTWLEYLPDTHIIHRDLIQNPPSFIHAEWLGAVFRESTQKNDAQSILLAESDQYIAEVEQAEVIVITSPMYNYGMPAVLKAWFDQVIRINKTFNFDLSRGDFPLEPIFSGKTLVLLSSTGEFGFKCGGIRERMNHLGTHIQVLSHYLGVEDFYEIRSEYQEFADQRHQNSLENAKFQTIELAKKLTQHD